MESSESEPLLSLDDVASFAFALDISAAAEEAAAGALLRAGAPEMFRFDEAAAERPLPLVELKLHCCAGGALTFTTDASPPSIDNISGSITSSRRKVLYAETIDDNMMN